jgi:hypothetical protein
LVAALSRHDQALRGHSERVRAYSELIADALGLDRGARDGLRWAGLMHDIGKLEIPAAVLNKAGPLSPDEWELVRRHPQTGAEMCAPLVPWLGEWTSAVLDHHERWDGRGYPRGLADIDISLAGRVVAVADAFDVMTSARSYKKPRPVDQAMAELVRCSGTQFDPNVVRAFVDIPEPQLRRVMGPVMVWAQRPFGSRSLGRLVDTFGGPMVAICVAAIVGILSPIGGPTALTPARPPAVVSGLTSPAGTRAAAPRDASVDPLTSAGPASSQTPPAVAAASPPAHGPDTPAPPAMVAPPPAIPEPPTDGNSSSPPTTVAKKTTAAVGTTEVTIDPDGGTVTVRGPSSISAPNVTVGPIPGAGHAICPDIGACQPVTITVPVGTP